MPRETLLIYHLHDQWTFHIPLMGRVALQPYFDGPERVDLLQQENRFYLPIISFEQDGTLLELRGITALPFVIDSIADGFSLTQNNRPVTTGAAFINDGFTHPDTVITYNPANDPEARRGGALIYSSGPGLFRHHQQTVQLVVEKTFAPANPETDNSIDHRMVMRPKRIEAGRGRDSIITGIFDDTVIGGIDDDVIDLSAYQDDHDAVEIRVQQQGEIYIAFDGGDTVTGFTPGQDSLDFSLYETASEGRQAEVDILGSLGTGVIVMPVIEFAEFAPMITSLSPCFSAWVNYRMSGLEFHFAEAIILPSGRLTGTILDICFAPAFHLRGDIFISKAGDGFDPAAFAINDRGIIEDLLAGEFHHREGVLDDPAIPGAMTVQIYENHPLNKMIHQVSVDAAWADGGVWSLAEMPGVLEDGGLFRVDGDGRLWTDAVLDYENPGDYRVNNNYQIKLHYTEPGGDVHDRWVAVAVQDIRHEYIPADPSTWNKEAVRFRPEDIIDGESPDLNTVAASVVSGEAWLLPEAEALIFTWLLKTPQFSPQVTRVTEQDGGWVHDATTVNQSLLVDQDSIDAFRAYVVRAFAEYERLMNVKMIEVAHTERQRGEVEILYTVHHDRNHVGGSSSTPGGSQQNVVIKNHLNLNGMGFNTELGFTDLGFRYSTIVHEIGHFFGLKHPFNDATFGGKSLGWPIYSDDHPPPRGSHETVMNWGWAEQVGDQLVLDNDMTALLFLYGAAGTQFDGVESHLHPIRVAVRGDQLALSVTDHHLPHEILWRVSQDGIDLPAGESPNSFAVTPGLLTAVAAYSDDRSSHQLTREFEVVADYFGGQPTLASGSANVPLGLNTILNLGQLPVDELLVVLLDGNTATGREHGWKVRDEVKAYLPKGVAVELIFANPKTHVNFPPPDPSTARGSIDAFTSNAAITAHNGSMIVVSASNLHPVGLTERYSDIVMIKAAGNYGGTNDPYFKYQGAYAREVLDGYGDQLFWVVGVDGEDASAPRHDSSSKVGAASNVFAAPFQTAAGVSDGGTSFAAPYFAAQVAKLWLVMQKFNLKLKDLLPVLKTLADNGDEDYDQIGHGSGDLGPLIREDGHRVFLDTGFFETRLPDIIFPEPDSYEII